MKQHPRQPTVSDPLRVLIFPGGTEIGLEIGSALRYAKEVVVTSAGSDVPNHAPYVFRQHRVVPDVDSDGWLSELNRVIGRDRIEAVFPAHDDVGFALAQHASQLAAPVIGSPPETCRVTRYKSKTYDLLRDVVAVAAVYADPDSVPGYPVFVKPDRGQGSAGARRVDSREELAAALAKAPDLLVLENLPGREYTVDCFTDREAGLQYCRGRERVRTRAGIAMTTRGSDAHDFRSWADAISSKLVLHGAWFFQVKEDAGGGLKLLEVGPRVAGAMAWSRALGVNLPLLSVYESCRIAVTVRPHALEATMDRALVNRFAAVVPYEAVYVDLDDTLIFRGRVNADIVRLVYQAVESGKWAAVVTRSREDPEVVLRRYRVRELFDEVIWLQGGEPKSQSCTRRPAVLIDDSHREREEATRSGILTLDAGMIDLLQDSRG